MRYFMPLKSSGPFSSFLNQPSGWVGMAKTKKPWTLRLRIFWVSSS